LNLFSDTPIITSMGSQLYSLTEFYTNDRLDAVDDI